MDHKLVSVICVCYNHSKYLEEALQSVFEQTYSHIQLIVVDDGSTDDSRVKLTALQNEKAFDLLLLEENIGYCKAFNKGLAMARGELIIDLAGDDRLMPDRVALGVEYLWPTTHGVQFGDVRYIDGLGNTIGTHYKRNSRAELAEEVPHGNVYSELLRRYFICAPSMMIKKEVLDQLGGYDEQLAYEDFDFWVRSSRSYTYQFMDAVLVEKRVLSNSLSKIQYTQNDSMMNSTLKVCQKALKLNRNRAEHEALAVRLHYEIRQAIICHHYLIAKDLLQLLKHIEGNSKRFKFWNWLVRKQWNFKFLMPLIRPAR